jgi:hypothetical protein
MLPFEPADESPRGKRQVGPQFPIRLDLEYRQMTNRTILLRGNGRTVSMSGESIVFESEPALQPGLRIEVRIQWPVKLNLVVDLVLQVFGRTIAAPPGCSAILMERYDFRTCCSRPVDVVQPGAAS